MKKWKIMRTITIAILIIFIVIVLWNLISAYTVKVTYPYPALGIEVNNWFDRFCIIMGIILYFLGIPMVVDIVLIIVSIIKLKRNKQE